jgi:hypothetical protein
MELKALLVSAFFILRMNQLVHEKFYRLIIWIPMSIYAS